MLPQQPPRRPRPLSAIKRLSTDTTSTLPAYSSPPLRPTPSQWSDSVQPHPLDEPPDYPQSAEEADQEDDFVPPRVPRSTASRRLRHRRGGSLSLPVSPSVDDLLERSVIALELSTNALLQSMDTHSSLSTLANDQLLERSLDRQTKMLDMRLKGNTSTHRAWMDDLDDVMKRVTDLVGDGADTGAGLSQSLPSGTSHIPHRRRHHRGMPKSSSYSGCLHLSSSELDVRDTLHPPRAMTQYVTIESTSGEALETTAGPESIYLPSTTGLRSPARIQGFASTGTSPGGLRKSVSSPGYLDLTSSTLAYTKLSLLASRQSSLSPSRTTTPASPPSPSKSDSTTSRTVRRNSAGSLDSNFTFPGNSRRSRSATRGGSSVFPETPPLIVRAMTPPMEEITPSSSSESCSSSHQVQALQTVQSLRKILNTSSEPKGKHPVVPSPSPRPKFRPRSSAVVPSFGTSTATASVSRLFTRNSHHTSSSQHPRPKHSSLKRSVSNPPTPLPPTSGIPTPSSRLSSTPGTPRQVSFAELPEAHSGRSRRKGKEKAKDQGKGKRAKDRENGPWWSAWLSSSNGTGVGRYDEKMEDRLMRVWARPSGGGGVTDDWML